MCERHLEDVLAAHPDRFFPGRGFQLVGRQESLRGVGIFDLLFADNRKRHWLIEVKARPLRITDTDQVMAYYEELRERNSGETYIPCFVATNIPPAVRNYLEGKGIEHKEITIAEFRRVAQEQGAQVECELFGVTRREVFKSAVSIKTPRISQRSDSERRGNYPPKGGDTMLTPVTSVGQVIENIRTYQSAVFASDRSTPAGVRHWYYLPDEDIAGPSRFIGYQNMTAARYDQVYPSGEGLDGKVTEPALERLHAFTEVYPGDDLYDKACAAAERLLPEGKRLRHDKLHKLDARFHILRDRLGA